MDARRAACSSRRSGCRTRRSSASPRRSSPRSAASRVPAEHARAASRRSTASAATTRCRSRSSARSCPTTSSRTGARAASAASRSCATAAWATRCPSTRRTTQVILEFGLKKPAFRIVVNSPTTHGSIGLTTGLDPAMTLGCGGYGGNITSDNISPRHLLNIKRLAYEIDAGRQPLGPAAQRLPVDGVGAVAAAAAGAGPSAGAGRHQRRRPDRGGSTSSSARAASRPEPGRQCGTRPGQTPRSAGSGRQTPTQTPLDFVCEEDVRLAIQARTQAGRVRAGDRDARRARSRRAAPRLRRRAVARLSRSADTIVTAVLTLLAYC